MLTENKKITWTAIKKKKEDSLVHEQSVVEDVVVDGDLNCHLVRLDLNYNKERKCLNFLNDISI